MNKIYKLHSDLEKYAHFIEKYQDVNDMFIDKYWQWKIIDLKTYKPITYELLRSDNGKKNYQFDLSTSHGLIIFSETAINILKPILEQTGQIVPIVTPSKRKNFFGFYPNRNIYNDSIINFNKSEWRQAEKGKIFYKIILNNNYPKDDYLFVLSSYAMGCFVTEKFKQIVEEHNLQGFDFSEYNEIKVDD